MLGLYTHTDFYAFSPRLQCATLARFLEGAMQKAIEDEEITRVHDVARILLEYRGILNDPDGNLEVVSACENIGRLELEDLASKGSKLSEIKDDFKDHRTSYGLSCAGSLMSHDWSLEATCNSLAAAFWWVMGQCEAIEKQEGGWIGDRLVAEGVRERLYAVFFNVLH